jgi:hypothetical protein
MNVILFGPKEEMLKQAYPAFAAKGIQVSAVLDDPERLRELMGSIDATAVIKLDAFKSIAEAEQNLSDVPGPKVIVAPVGWEEAKIPGTVARFSSPNWPEIVEAVRVARLQAPPQTPPPPPTPQPAPKAKKAKVRIGFYGQRGGVGTTTTCLRAAKMLAQAGFSVTIYDAQKRGDLHLMLGCEPIEEPLILGTIVVKMGLPDGNEEGAVIVDGGRKAWGKNIKWVEVSGPIPDEALRRLLGLEGEKKGIELPKIRVEFV